MKNSDFVRVGRRSFLKHAAMAAGGYALCVSIPNKARARDAAFSSNAKRLQAAQQSPSTFSMNAEPLMEKLAIECDVCVVGGGLSGVCAAIAAARGGAKTVLAQNRSRLGGNSSSEIRIHPLGISPAREGFREGGILEELKLENAVRNPQRSWEMWDLLLYEKCVAEPNLTLMLDTSVYLADTENGRVKSAYLRCDLTQKIFKVDAKYFVDATGDAVLARLSGCSVMFGRESSKKFGEPLADMYEEGGLLCSSILFNAVKHDRPMPFKAPDWAIKVTDEDMRWRNPTHDGFAYGYWFISYGGLFDTIKDNEAIRHENLSIVLGVWDYIKNSGKYPESANYAMSFVGMIPGKRDSYRIVGEHLLTQMDLEGDWAKRRDQIAVCGWKMEDQPSAGFFEKKKKPVVHAGKISVYNVPLASYIAKDADNLLMAGRHISCSHLAMTSIRIINTCAVGGEAVGTCAAKCVRENADLKKLCADEKKVGELQQELLKNGNVIVGIKCDNPDDLAAKARVSASDELPEAPAKNLKSGFAYDLRGKTDNRWQADISKKPSARFEWDSPAELSQVFVNLDAGNRLVTMSIAKFAASIPEMWEPQKELLRDFDLAAELPDGTRKTLAQVRGNYQKLVKISFPKERVKAIELKCLATNGSPKASVFQVQAFA